MKVSVSCRKENRQTNTEQRKRAYTRNAITDDQSWQLKSLRHASELGMQSLSTRLGDHCDNLSLYMSI